MRTMMARCPRAGHTLAAVVLATGCFSVPPFEPESGVSFTESDTGGGTASGTGFALRFSDGGLHFPDGLLIDGLDVMGRDSSQTCFDEDEIGFRIVPTARISATGGAPPVKNLLVPVLRGPGVVQVKLDWATQFKCNGSRAPGGISTYTMFPDGRIVRFDTIGDAIATEIVPSGCECEPPIRSEDQLFTISTHWTLARSKFETFSFDNNTEPVPAEGEEKAANHATSCIANDTYQVAFAWPLSMAMQMPLQTAVRGRTSLIEFRRDLVRGAPRLEAFSHDNSSAIFIERGGCAAAFKRANEHADPSSLAINGASMKPSIRDGIYGGDPGAGGLPGIDVPSGTATLVGPVDSSFAVWLRFPGSVDAIRATLGGRPKEGPWYLPQRVDDRTWIVWFKDAITATQTIVVEPR